MDPSIIGLAIFIILLVLIYLASQPATPAVIATPAVPSVNCVQSPWSACDPTNLTQTRSVTVDKSGNGEACGAASQACILPPKLIGDRIQYQGDCPNDCGGTIWNGTGPTPWNRFYKLECQNGDVKSAMVGPFGPVSHHLYSNPSIRLHGNGVNVCGTNTTNLYRATSVNGKYNKLDIPSWGGGSVYVDNDNSTTY